jgi:tetratricopeptide (TPR) repeat protein
MIFWPKQDMPLTAPLTSWSLDPAWDPLRRPPRDSAIRSFNYEDCFDFRTVFFDVFWDHEGKNIIALGPPLLNLQADLDIRFRALPSGDLCAQTLDHRVLVDRFTIRVPPGTTGLMAESRVGSVLLAPQPNLSALFAGTRALFTLNKDNDPAWVRDWARFYAVNHGCDAVAVYDNESTRYDSVELAKTLQEVPGIRRAVVIDWDFPYGAFDLRQTPSLNRIDSIYCQWGCFEHARLRLFRSAAGVTNADVDELIVANPSEGRGERTIYEAAEASPTGAVLFPGFWINCHPADLTAEIARTPRHRHFWKTNPLREGSEPKWTVVPARLPEEAQWDVHTIRGIERPITTEFTFRHFRPLNTNWNVDQPGLDALRTDAALDADATVEDLVLKAALDRAFPPAEGERPLPARREDGSADALRLRAGALLRGGAVEAALATTRRARELEPAHVNLALFEADLLRQLGRVEEAAAAEQDAARLREASPHWIFQMGYEAVQNGEIIQGIAEMRRAVDLAPYLHLHAVLLARTISTHRGDHAAAWAVADLAQRHCPDEGRPKLDLLRVALLMSNSAPGEVFPILGRILDRIPNDGRPLMYMARALNANGRHQEALRHLDRALEILGAPGVLRDRLAREAARRVTYACVAWLADWAVEPLRQEFLHLKATTLSRLGRHAEAIEIMREVIALTPATAGYVNELGIFLQQDGRVAEARSAWEKARDLLRWELSITPPTSNPAFGRHLQRARGLARLAAIHASLGEHDDAERTAREAVALLPTDRHARASLARALLDLGRHEEAIAECREIVALDPQQAERHDQLSQVLARAGRTDEARTSLERAIALHERPTGDLYMRLSRLHAQSGNTESAVEAARSAVMVDPQRASHWLSLGMALQGAKLYDEAAEAAREALTLEPSRFGPWLVRGQALHALSRNDEALEAAREAMRLAPDDMRGSLLFVRVALALKRYEAAEAPLRRALAAEPGNATVHYLASVMHRGLGCFPNALLAARQAVALAPGTQFFAKHLRNIEGACGTAVAA